MSVSVTNKVSDWRLHINLGGPITLVPGVVGRFLTGTVRIGGSVAGLHSVAGEGVSSASGLPPGALRPGLAGALTAHRGMVKHGFGDLFGVKWC